MHNYCCTHTLWYTTHKQYRRGKGVAIALHKRLDHCYHSHQIHDEHQLLHLQLKHLLPQNAPLHIFCWYLPHSQSTQLRGTDLLSRYTYMTSIGRPDHRHTTGQLSDHRWRPQCQGGYISVSQQLRSRSHLAAQCSMWQTQAPAHQPSQTAAAP
jgi:hypothetical protein